MNINYALIDQFIEAIFPLPDNFGLIDYDEPVDYDIIRDAVEAIDKDAYVCFGMSKLVIISPKLGDAIIKIPFNGYYDGYDWYFFCEARGSDYSDYCLAEYEKYKELKKQHLDCFVAKTLFYKIVDNTRIFIQEAVISENDIDIDEQQPPSKKSLKIAKSWYEMGDIAIDPEWVATCIDCYGISKVEKFLNYCNNIDYDILDDCHHGNYGYRRKGGTPAILDYSNFLDS